MGGEEGEPLRQDGKMARAHGMDAACSKMAGMWASAPGRGGRQAGPGGGKSSLTSGPLPILFHNEIKLPEIELIVGNIARMGEKFSENLWRKM
jgi:hypothetical protein